MQTPLVWSLKKFIQLQCIYNRGACFEENDVCNQKCQTVRDDCKHTCANECHIGKPCPKTPCLEMVS